MSTTSAAAAEDRFGSSPGPSAGGGAARSADALLEEVYTDLRRLARRQMASERSDHTLQPTALVHEAYLRLLRDNATEWANSRHVYAAAAQAMRRILIERARRAAGPKRGGGRRRLELHAGDLVTESEPSDLLALDEALDELERLDARVAQVVLLRYFVGMSVEETASVLGASARSVKRDWAFARAWLFRRMSGGEAAGADDGADGGGGV